MKNSIKSRTNASHGVTWPAGFSAAGGACGIKANGKADLALIVADAACRAAGVFTANRMKSAPVLVDLRHLQAGCGAARAIVCNSGNANASTGDRGLADAIAMCRRLADAIDCQPHHVLVCSTGVIGRPMPIAKVQAGIDALTGRLARGPQADAAAAAAIMTTDLVPKTASRQVRLGGRLVRLAGMAKGSGMIAPHMATMLAFITTDAAIAAPALQRALRAAAAASFNRISVDQHTSPSDTAMILASGAAGNPPINRPGAGDWERFTGALTEVCQDLAYQIVKDGEGASKVFRVEVVGAVGERDADRVGRTIVDSPLVKCAVHGADPNWGRITTAAGYSGVAVEPGRMSLYVGGRRGVCVFTRGQPTAAGLKPTARLKKLMAQREVHFIIDLGMGKASVTWLGCDLSRDYVAINADYTT